ncbi:MAG TPA: glutathione S-transferase family protein [Acetobacteraceae bacterium]|nr:glutathione S-transferase family protein [Acetobacteraceae bacterium]
MPDPVLFGAAYSVYVRIVRLALAEKRVPYRLHEVDVFAPGGLPADYRERHLFNRIPAFEHDGFRLYEAGAIARYVDEAFPGAPLQPADVRQRARMNQAISVLDAYAYRTLVWDVFVERVRAPAQGRDADEARIAAAMPRAATCLAALQALMDGRAWLAGDGPTLADLHAAPMFAYFTMTPEGRDLITRHGKLLAWWEAISARESMAQTRSPFE